MFNVSYVFFCFKSARFLFVLTSRGDFLVGRVDTNTKVGAVDMQE